MDRLSPCVLIALCTSPLALTAQPTLEPGMRVRLDHDCAMRPLPRARGSIRECHRSEGTVLRTAADTIVLETGSAGLLLIRPSRVQRLWVSRGRRSAVVKGTAIGLGTGALVGGLLGAVAASNDDSRGDWSCRDSELNCAAVVAVFVGAMGAVVGGVLGLPLRERWSDVPVGALQIAVLPAAGGGALLGVRFAF